MTTTTTTEELLDEIDADEDDWGPEDEIALGCECEIDWNCGLHANRRGTWIETRYDDLDDGEARAFGRPFDNF